MAGFVRFPDVQKLLVQWVTTVDGVTAAGSETPETFTDRLPFVRILRTGGGSDWLNDRASVDIDVFAALYADGEPLAERVRQQLMGPPPPVVFLDRAECEIGPRELPWGDGLVRRWHATYTLTSRRYSA